MSTRRGLLIANSADAGAREVLTIITGAAIPLITQALIAFLRRRSGQRKIVVQWLDHDDERLKRVEVETPRLSEIDQLLRKAETVFVEDTVDRKGEKSDSAS